MANPDWAINLFDRSETVLEFLKRSGLSSQSFSNLTARLSKSFTPTELNLPPGEMYKSLEHCLISNFSEGCVIGGGMSILVSILPALLKGNIRRAVKNVATSSNMKVALFFGGLMSACNGGLYWERKNMSDPHTRKRIRVIIGFLSGLSVSILPKGVRRFIVYLLLSRSFEVAARIVKSKLIQRRRGSIAYAATPVTTADEEIVCDQEMAEQLPISEDIFTSHEVIGLACTSMTIIIAAWFRYASLELIPKSYLSFLHGINNLTAKQVSDVSKIISGEYTEADPELVGYANDRLCRAIHPPHQPCMDFLINFVFKGIITRTGPFYLKIYALPLAVSVFKRRGNISRLMISHYLTRVWWSSLFLATMNATVATTVCFLSKCCNSFMPQEYQVILGGTASGLSLYIEQEGRRLELALYLFGQAIQILVNAYTNLGLPSPRGMDIITSAASISLMTYAFWEREERGRLTLIRPGYASLLGKIIDTNDTRHAFRI
jgi:hypothetical protein